jgi:hypothetical protein
VSAADGEVARYRLAARLDRAVAGLAEEPASPTVVVDLDAFDANAADLVRRAGGKPVRVASKSLRVPPCSAVPDPARFPRVLAYTLREALWLCEQGVSDDLVLGYHRGPGGAGAAHRRRRGRRCGHADGRRPVQLDLVDAVRPRGGPDVGSPSTSTPACGSVARTSGPSGPRCTTSPRSPTSPARSRHVPVSSWSAR